MLKKMCDYHSINTETPNWYNVYSLYKQQYGYIPFRPYIKAALRYCDNCGAELYWTYYAAEDTSMTSELKAAAMRGDNEMAVQLVREIKNLKEYEEKNLHSFEDQWYCPLCTHALEEGEGFIGEQLLPIKTTEAQALKRIKQKFHSMRWKRSDFYEQKDRETSRKEYENCIHQIKEELSLSEMLPFHNITSENVKKSVDKLCEYLSHAIELEQNIYMVEKRLQMILNRMPESRRDAYFAMQDRRDEMFEKVNEEEEKLEKRIKEISDYSYASFGLSLLAFPQQPVPPVRPAEPVYEMPGIFNKKRVMERNSLLEQQYNDALRQYDVDSELYNSNIQAYQGECARISAINNNVANELSMRKQALEMAARTENKTKVDQIKKEYCDENRISEVLVKQMLENELQLAKKTCKELLVAKERYYSPDIIFGKYRDFAPVATIYEYLKAGRCTTLEGPDGAYNLYESELRSNTIIAKLDVVIEKLEELKNTQYMLCNALEDINCSLSSIDGKLDKACWSLENISNSTESIAQNSAVIAYNSETTAFYSKMTASISAAMLL